MNLGLKKVIVGATIVTSVCSFAISNSFANYIQHKVESGDTLWKISQRYEITMEDLYQINPKYLTNSNLFMGEVVNISLKKNTYLVKSGDTPWTISNKFGLTLQQFMSVNNLHEGKPIYPGDTVVISAKSNVNSPNTANKNTTYIVQRGDTPWIISNKFNMTVVQFLALNSLKEGDHIYPGDTVIIANSNTKGATNSSFINYTVKSGDTPWTISNSYKIAMNDLLVFNGLTQKDIIYPGQVLKIPALESKPNQSPNASTPQKTFINHTVVSGDDLWKISIKYGIPFHEVLKINGFKENHIINIGDQINIPVYHIPVKTTMGAQYGELLDWWTEAQYVVPIGTVFKIIDFETGKEWFAKRTIGANHADCEPLTAKDSAIMKEVWGGTFSWNRRSVIVEVDNRRLAASASSTPHDIQYITNNNFQGHFDLYFLNATRHVDGKQDEGHQKNVLISAGH